MKWVFLAHDDQFLFSAETLMYGELEVDILIDAKLSVMTESIASIVLYKSTVARAKLNLFIVLAGLSGA